MAFSTSIHNWKRFLERRWALYQAVRRKAVARRLATRPNLEFLEDRWLLTTYVVTSTAQFGTGTLYDAITQANAGKYTEIDFAIGNKGGGPYVQTISPDSLPALTASGVFINGYSENQWEGWPSTPPLLELNGSRYALSDDGLDLTGTSNTVSGLFITSFLNGIEVGAGNNVIGGTTAGAGNVISGNSGDGVKIDSGVSGVAVLGNYIGTNVYGTAALGNSIGVEVAGNNNTVGTGNVISGNSGDGVKIDTGVSGVVVQGNNIGTDNAGSNAVGNSIGIEVAGSNNTLGASWAVAPNEISGNRGDGVKLDSGSSGNVVMGSYIGNNGTAAVANSVGIEDGGSSNTIGGDALGDKNVISGNNGDGVLIDSGGKNETMQGNYIGTDYRAMVALPNGNKGVEIFGTGNTIGGNSGANYFVRNFISGGGVLIRSGASGNQVAGNFIGLNVFGIFSGIVGMGNGIGVDIEGSSNTVGGTSSGYRNVISDSAIAGISVDSTGAGNVIESNYVGTDYTGLSYVSNGWDNSTGGSGIYIEGNNNTVGGTASSAGNILSGNIGDGLIIDGIASGNLVQGNLVGLQANGSIALNNSGDGIYIAGNNNTVGGTASGARNIISGNTKDGVLIDKDGVLFAGGGSGNQVLGNWIGTNYDDTAAVANSIGVEVAGNSNTIGSTVYAARNIISSNTSDGVKIDSGASGNQVLGDYIGVNVYDNAALGNGTGIEVGGSSNTLGASWAVAPNVISDNSGDGVKLDGGSSGNVVLGSYIGTDHTGTVVEANSIGIEDGGSGNLIGGSVLGARNVISGNSGDGVLITGTKETMEGNYIGSDYSVSTAIANGSNGVEIQGTANTIGGNGSTTSLITNFISGNNKGDGVKIDSGASGNTVVNNFIGVQISGKTGLANSVGIEIGGSNNTVGGTTNAYTNVISGNSSDGVLLDSTGAGNVIQGSYIGTDYTGTAALGNRGNGIAIAGNNNTVGAGNIIAYNSNNGVQVSSGAGNTITQNSIFANTGLGISLASGANNNIVAPSILTATLSSGTLTVTGTFNAPTASVPYVLEFFANSSSDAEGRIYLGSVTVTPATTGTTSFTFSTTNTSQLGTYPLITATLTDASGDTSAFSNGVTDS